MNSTESRNQTEMDSSEDLNTDSEEDMDMEGMNHSGSGKIPDCLKEAENPTHEVGSQAAIKADHMEGISGVEGGEGGSVDHLPLFCRIAKYSVTFAA